MPACEARGRVLVSGLVVVVVLFVGSWVWYSVATNVKEVAAEEAVAEDEEREGKGKGEAKGKAKGGKKGEGETKA